MKERKKDREKIKIKKITKENKIRKSIRENAK